MCKNQSRRIITFDYLKVTCFCMVIITHLPAYSDALKVKTGFPFWGAQAVPLFIIVSSFLLSGPGFILEDDVSYFSRRGLFWRRLNRILMPYTLINTLIYIIDLLFLSQDPISKLVSFSGNPISYWIVGGRAPGGYYIPILIQLYALLPALLLLKRNRKFLIPCMILTNVVFESLACTGVVPASIYRLCIFRYFGVILAGLILRDVWERGLFIQRRLIITVIAGLLLFVGSSYLFAINYMGMPPLSVTTAWRDTTLATAPYSCAIIMLLLIMETKLSRMSFVSEPGAILHLASISFFVYLAQMIFFMFLKIPVIASLASSLNVCFQGILSIAASICLGNVLYIILSKISFRLRFLT